MNLPPEACLGADLGRQRDYLTIAVISEPVYSYDHLGRGEFPWRPVSNFSPQFAAYLRRQNTLSTAHYRDSSSPVILQSLKRIEIGTPYPEVRQRILDARSRIV